MTQIYYLELTDAALPINRLARELQAVAVAAGLLTDQVRPEALSETAVTLDSGLTVDVSPAMPPGPDQFTADFGIERAAQVGLQVDATQAFAPQVGDLLVLTTGLLERLAGDAVLHFEYDVVWLLRQDGRLYLSDNDELWRPERLGLVRQPYQRAPLAFSDVTHARGNPG